MKHKWITILFSLCLIPVLAACGSNTAGDNPYDDEAANAAAYEALIETGSIDLGNDRIPPLAIVADGREPLRMIIFDDVPDEVLAAVTYAIDPGSQAQGTQDAQQYFQYLLEKEGFEALKPGATAVDEYTVYYLRKDSADAGMAILMRIYYNQDELVLDIIKMSAGLIEMQTEGLLESEPDEGV